MALVVYSRYELQHPAPAIQPAVGTHWFAALGFDVCGTPQANLATNPNATKSPIPGLRTDGDGVIQVAPTTAKDAGDNATLARFVALYPKLTLTSGSLSSRASRPTHNGEKCPTGTPDAGKAGSVQIKVWPSFTPPGSNHPVTQTDASSVRLADGQLITVAFVRAGRVDPEATLRRHHGDVERPGEQRHGDVHDGGGATGADVERPDHGRVDDHTHLHGVDHVAHHGSEDDHDGTEDHDHGAQVTVTTKPGASRSTTSGR